MKKFLLKILIFLLPIILLGYFVDLFISTNLRKSNLYAQKEYPTWNAILEGKLDANILIYGSSRAWVHFDPKIIEDSLQQPAYNLGIDGHTFNMQYLRHLLTLENNPKPKLIIHSIDIGTLEKGNLYNADQFLPYMLWDKTFYEYLSKYKGFTYLDFKIPLMRYYGKWDAIRTSIEMLIIPRINQPQRIRGYQGQNKTWNQDLDKAREKMTKYVIKFDKPSAILFDQYLKECKEQQIEVILVYPPIYIEGQEFIANQDEIIQGFQAFADKYDFMFLDYSDDELCLNKDYFYNASHMNKTGAELFTKKLCTEIKKQENISLH